MSDTIIKKKKSCSVAFLQCFSLYLHIQPKRTGELCVSWDSSRLSPLQQSHCLAPEDKKVKVTAVYCIKAAAFLISDATHMLLKATLSVERVNLADCCPATRWDAEFKLSRGLIILDLLALMRVQQSEDHDQGV